ncbi:MAG: hypothetical protein RI897_778 [Verrucomicrobiota bacterium]
MELWERSWGLAGGVGGGLEAGERLVDFLDRGVFAEVIYGAFFEAIDDCGFIGDGGEHDHEGFGVGGEDFGEGFGAGFDGHTDVEEDEVGVVGGDGLDGFLAVGGFADDLESDFSEDTFQPAAAGEIIIDYDCIHGRGVVGVWRDSSCSSRACWRRSYWSWTRLAAAVMAGVSFIFAAASISAASEWRACPPTAPAAPLSLWAMR